jgi:hypothetical protein
MDDVAAIFAMGVDDPTRIIAGNRAAITTPPASSTELVNDGLPSISLAA